MIGRIKQKISEAKEACNYNPLTRVIPSADILEIMEQEKEKPQTNADRIRSMTDDELAEFLFDFKNDFVKPNEDMTYEEWLRAESGFCGDILLHQNSEGLLEVYDDTYDLIIHCRNQEEWDMVAKMLNGMKLMPLPEQSKENEG